MPGISIDAIYRIGHRAGMRLFVMEIAGIGLVAPESQIAKGWKGGTSSTCIFVILAHRF